MRTPYLFILLFTVFTLSCEEQKSVEGTSPNVIIIMTDDQGWGDLSFHGNTNLETPNIDLIAKNSVRFENFYVQPVCSPSRAELLTGRYHPRLGIYSTSAGGERLNLDETTIAEVFKQAGYSTAVVGKWHNGSQAPYHPNSRGFDHFYGFTSGHWANYFDPRLEENGRWTNGSGFIIDDLTSNAIDFIEESDHSPFFLWLTYNTPHSPMQVPQKYWDSFANKTLFMRHRDSLVEDIQFTRASLAMVENIDWNVGRITALLKQKKIADNTIIVFLSDNGPNGWRWNQGMKGKKGSTDEGGVRSPLFVKWDGKIERGRTISNIAGAIDLMPTLTGLTGISGDVKKPLDGKDLSPLILDTDTEWAPRTLFQHWNNETSLRTQTYRLDHDNKLFNIIEDRGQHNDLTETLPEIRDSLMSLKESWLADVYPAGKDPADRPFTLGHADLDRTWLPARDGIPHGDIMRSNRYPNASFFTNWVRYEDYISWDVNVLTPGIYEAVIYYTAETDAIGSVIQLSFGSNVVVQTILKAHDPDLEGMENDRYPRIESYTKEFKALVMGEMTLSSGRNNLNLRALKKPGVKVIDVEGLQFRRVSSLD